MAFAVVQRFQRVGQQRLPARHLLVLGQGGFLAVGIVDQPILPLTLAVQPNRRVQAVVRRGQAAVHVDHVLLGHRQRLGDLGHLLRLQIAVIDRLHLALQTAQVEKQLLLCRGGAHLHERPAVQDVFLNRGADPPHCVSSEAEAAVRIEPFHRLHHADIALADQFADGQAVATIAHGDLGDEAEMGRDEPVRGIDVFVVAPTMGQRQFFFWREHREFADLLKIPR